jgi:hypothetical protein
MTQAHDAHIKLIDSYIAEYRRLIKAGDKEAALEFDELCNGPGSELFFLREFHLPDKWHHEFYEPSVFHDVASWAGGTRFHEAVSHEEFYLRCRRKAFLNPAGRFWAFLSYRAVKATGHWTFDHYQTPLSFSQLRAKAQGELQEKRQGINKL